MVRPDPREQFTATAIDLVARDDDTAIVYAEIAGQYLTDAPAAIGDRVINVGIREQLLVDVGAGLSLAGLF